MLRGVYCDEALEKYALKYAAAARAEGQDPSAVAELQRLREDLVLRRGTPDDGLNQGLKVLEAWLDEDDELDQLRCEKAALRAKWQSTRDCAYAGPSALSRK